MSKKIKIFINKLFIKYVHITKFSTLVCIKQLKIKTTMNYTILLNYILAIPFVGKDMKQLKL